MSATSALATAISGLLGQARSVAVAAGNIVNASTPGYRPAEVTFSTVRAGGPGGQGGVSTRLRAPPPLAAQPGSDSEVDIAQEFVRMIHAQAAYAASAKVIVAAGQMSRSLIDIEV